MKLFLLTYFYFLFLKFDQRSFKIKKISTFFFIFYKWDLLIFTIPPHLLSFPNIENHFIIKMILKMSEKLAFISHRIISEDLVVESNRCVSKEYDRSHYATCISQYCFIPRKSHYNLSRGFSTLSRFTLLPPHIQNSTFYSSNMLKCNTLPFQTY